MDRVGEIFDRLPAWARGAILTPLVLIAFPCIVVLFAIRGGAHGLALAKEIFSVVCEYVAS